MAKKKSTKKTKKKTKALPRVKGLLAKHKRFVEEYLIDLNGTQAAIRAGYSESGAPQQAVALLKKPEIRKALEKASRERSERTKIRAERILEDLAWIAHSDISDYEFGDTDEPIRAKPGVPQEVMRAVSSVEATVLSQVGQTKLVKVKFRLWNKMKAKELAMKHLNMLTERIELEHNHRVSIYIPDNGRAG